MENECLERSKSDIRELTGLCRREIMLKMTTVSISVLALIIYNFNNHLEGME